MTEVLHINEDDFQDRVLNSKQPVLVDFWAPWCAPCKAIAPILEDVAKIYADKISITKIDIEQNNKIAIQYGIRSIPTLLIFKDGKVEVTKIGALSKSQLEKIIDSVI